MGAQECGILPPQETGLTYNSWFGKFHLEMTWWHLAHYGLWNKPECMEKCFGWFLYAQKLARQIAKRQGFNGIRWMKMTDPSGIEAPSNVGLILSGNSHISSILPSSCIVLPRVLPSAKN